MSADAAATIGRLRVLQELEGLVASKLLIAFVERRVLLLQGRPHPIFWMSRHHDPSRLCTKEMPTAEVARMVNDISDLKVSEGDWPYKKRSYSRDDPPPAVSPLISSFSSVFQSCSYRDATPFWIADLYVRGDGRLHGAGW